MSEVVPMREGQPIVDPMTAAVNRMEQIITDVKRELDANIPEDVISERVGGGGRKLSYLEGWYVISRLNKIFGQGAWYYVTEDPKLVYSDTVDGYGHAAYTAKVTVVAMGVRFTDVGYGDGKDKHMGKAHESAVKEAVTDGLKRAAKNFGMSMGLALYDKSKEFVGGEEQPKVGTGNTKSAKVNKSAGIQGNNQPASTSTPNSNSAGTPSGTAQTEVNTPAKTREEVNDLLVSSGRVAIAKRKFTDWNAIKEYMLTKYSTGKKEELTDAQAKDFLDYLTAMIYN